MSFEDHWGLLVISSPQLNDLGATIHLTVAKLERQLMRAYTAGVNDTKVIHEQLDGILGRRDAIVTGDGP